MSREAQLFLPSPPGLPLPFSQTWACSGLSTTGDTGTDTVHSPAPALSCMPLLSQAGAWGATGQLCPRKPSACGWGSESSPQRTAVATPWPTAGEQHPREACSHLPCPAVADPRVPQEELQDPPGRVPWDRYPLLLTLAERGSPQGLIRLSRPGTAGLLL